MSDHPPVLDFATDATKAQIPDTVDTRLAYLYGALRVHETVCDVVLGLMSDDPAQAAVELVHSLAAGLKRMDDAFSKFSVTPPGAEP